MGYLLGYDESFNNLQEGALEIQNIYARIDKRYNTNTYGEAAHLAFLYGSGNHDFYFVRLFNDLLDLDERDGTNTADMLFKYLILDQDSKKIVLNLLDKLPQSHIKK